MAMVDQLLEAAEAATNARLAPLAGAAKGVPGVLVGTDASLDSVRAELLEAVRAGLCVIDGVPDAREWMRRNGWGALELPLAEEVPSVAALHLALRAIGCDPIVLVGVGGAAVDGLVCGAADERRLDWAVETGPFHTIEDLHLASIRFGAEATGSGIAESEARSLELLERLIERDRANGRRTLQIGSGGRRLRDTDQAGVSQALPARDAFRMSTRLLATLRSRREPWPRAAGTAGGVIAVSASSEARVAHAIGGAAATRIRGGPRTLEIRSARRVAAIVAIDPDSGGTGVPRHLDSEFGAGPVLGATLARLGHVRGIESIVLLTPSRFDPRPLFDPARVGVPVEIEACGTSVLPPEQAAIRTARLWSDTAWRGGIGGATIWDEIVAPGPALAALERRGLEGALCVGADWPLVMVEELGGCDRLVERFRESEAPLDMTACPGPPGLGACVLDRSLLASLAKRSGPVLIGDRWRMGRPLLDPGCVAPVDRIRRSMVRACFDSARAKLRLRRAIEPIAVEQSKAHGLTGLGAWTVVEALEHQFFHLPPAFAPQHLIIEINTGRRASGSVSPHRVGSIQRPAMSERTLERILEEVEPPRDVVITFGHVGDPLWHPLLPRFVRMARNAGARAVHVRTELLADAARIDALLESEPDVISVDLHALGEASYRALMGIHRMDRVMANLERVTTNGGGAVAAAHVDPRLRRPLWVVRMQRRAETLSELRPFAERWEKLAASAVIEGIPPASENPASSVDPLLPCEVPVESVLRESMRRMVILSDGTVPFSELDLLGERTIGSVVESGVFGIWRELMPRRRQRGRDRTTVPRELHWWQP